MLNYNYTISRLFVSNHTKMNNNIKGIYYINFDTNNFKLI